MANSTFVLLFLFAGLTFCARCLQNPKLWLLDCFGQNLTHLPQFNGKPWVASLDLGGNLLTSACEPVPHPPSDKIPQPETR